MSDQTVSIYCLTRMANFFLLVEREELTMIDTGTKDSIKNITAKIERLGFKLADLKRIIATHSHADHTANLAALQQATGATVLAHEAEVPFIAHQARLARPRGIAGFLFHLAEPLMRSPAAEVDLILHDGDIIEGPGLKVIHTPGHTPGHICLYQASAKALFTGDAILNRSGSLQGPSPFFSSDIDTATKSVVKLIDLDVETIYFAHGEVMRGVEKNAIAKAAKEGR